MLRNSETDGDDDYEGDQGDLVALDMMEAYSQVTETGQSLLFVEMNS